MADNRQSRITWLARAAKWGTGALLTGAAVWLAWIVPDWQPVADRWTAVGLLFWLAYIAAMVQGVVVQRLRNGRGLPLVQALGGGFLLLLALVVLLTPAELNGRGVVIVVYIVLGILLFGLAMVFVRPHRESLTNFATIAISTVVMLILIEVLIAPFATRLIANAQRQAALAAVTAPLDQSELTPGTTTPVESANPQGEFIEQGPGPAWGELTGWGTNTDTILRWWLPGEYDNLIEYNSQGFRGPEVAYDKPDDVYRILIIGDSFIEAREVTYDDTIYAGMNTLLADARTPDGRRFEVFGVGATGWGTLQAYLYYHHEGYRFSPDLVIHTFYINDIADNNPQHFYSDRNIDFAIGDNSVQVIRDGVSAETQSNSDPASRWLDSLPVSIAGTNTVALIRQVIAPPREVVTLAGGQTQIHPQNYIYVSQPDIDGYPEGWRRTQRAYEIWAHEAAANGTQLMVLNIDIGVARITEISTYFADQQQGWIWDVDLPQRRLTDILQPLNVPLINTRPVYEAYGESVNQRPYDALFIPGDGHWNATGHRITAAFVVDTLHERGLIADP